MYQINRGASYSIVNHESIAQNELWENFLSQPIGKYKNVLIYDLKSYATE